MLHVHQVDSPLALPTLQAAQTGTPRFLWPCAHRRRLVRTSGTSPRCVIFGFRRALFVTNDAAPPSLIPPPPSRRSPCPSVITTTILLHHPPLRVSPVNTAATRFWWSLTRGLPPREKTLFVLVADPGPAGPRDYRSQRATISVHSMLSLSKACMKCCPECCLERCPECSLKCWLECCPECCPECSCPSEDCACVVESACVCAELLQVGLLGSRGLWLSTARWQRP